MKTAGRKIWIRKVACLILVAFCVGLIGTVRTEAASKPAKPSISLKKRTKTKATIKIKKKGSVTGYQVALKTSKKGKFRIVMPTKKRTVVLTKLKANKVYYVKIRAFRTRGYRIRYGKYSRVLKIGKYKKSKTPQPTETPLPSETPQPEETIDPTESAQPEESGEPQTSEAPDATLAPTPQAPTGL